MHSITSTPSPTGSRWPLPKRSLVTAQAEAVAFIDNFKLMMYVSLLAIPLVILVQRPRRPPGNQAPALD
jgi:hypothetical protein